MCATSRSVLSPPTPTMHQGLMSSSSGAACRALTLFPTRSRSRQCGASGWPRHLDGRPVPCRETHLVRSPGFGPWRKVGDDQRCGDGTDRGNRKGLICGSTGSCTIRLRACPSITGRPACRAHEGAERTRQGSRGHATATCGRLGWSALMRSNESHRRRSMELARNGQPSGNDGEAHRWR
jgi:hypothetical protein